LFRVIRVIRVIRGEKFCGEVFRVEKFCGENPKKTAVSKILITFAAQ
jgi:hypothetical protein